MYIIIYFLVIFVILKIFKNNEVPDVKWPFLNIQDENSNNLNILCIRAYIDNPEYEKQFIEYINKGYKFIGCSSNQSFPRICDNPYGSCQKEKKINGKYIEEYVIGWCHCFRKPNDYIKGNIPKILLSESDFNSERLEIKNLTKKYDYITIQPIDNDKCTIGWNGYYKNWNLAEKCIKILSDELNLKGLIVGRDKCPINIINQQNIETTAFLPYFDFIDKIRMSKFILLPNLEEASPRVLTESLCVDVPIFVYKNILGGWKYVNNDTGLFFDENNIKQQCIILLENIKNKKYKPRNYFINNHGLKYSGKKLKNFIKKLYPNLKYCEYAKFAIS